MKKYPNIQSSIFIEKGHLLIYIICFHLNVFYILWDICLIDLIL